MGNESEKEEDLIKNIEASSKSIGDASLNSNKVKEALLTKAENSKLAKNSGSSSASLDREKEIEIDDMSSH